MTEEKRSDEGVVELGAQERLGLEAALDDVRVRCGGYRDSRVDGDGGIVAVVVRERDEARAALAALREAVVRLGLTEHMLGVRRSTVPIVYYAIEARNDDAFEAAVRVLDAVLADSAAAAEAHDRRIRAETLREAALRLRAAGARTEDVALLHAMADEAERGAP